MKRIKNRLKTIIQTNVLGGGNFSCRHPKLYKWLISNLKALFIGGAISFVVTASATVILHSRQVRYKNDKSVEQAINELYEKAEPIKMKKMGCDGCTKLEYLESTGTQYIDTEIKHEIDIGVNMTFSQGMTGNEMYQGCMEYMWSKRFYLPYFRTDNGMAYGYNNNYYNTGIKITLNEKYNTLFNYLNDRKVIFDGVLVGDNLPVYETNLVSIYLFAANNGRDQVYNYMNQLKIFEIKISDEDTIVRDYIPVLDKNNRPCLFDKVSKTCFYNQGTGEFLYG